MQVIKRFIRGAMLLGLMLVASTQATSQSLERVEPPFWWAGMVHPDLQLLVYGENISALKPELSYEGVELVKVTSVKNPNYLFLDLILSSDVKPGTFEIQFKKGKKVAQRYAYELKERREGSAERIGFTTEDVLYLITPDRFANGDPSNDGVEGLKEQPNREFHGGRHGGDIQGMTESLDYIEDMGFTSIWLNPVLENDMEQYSYHGYSTTDFYKVDPRFGTNEDYRDFALKAQEKGVKLIMDMIVNHCGSEHWWIKDFPMDDWVNYQEEFLNGEYHITTHRKPVIQDPYKSDIDLKEFADGWFVPTMPDLNQRNEFMGTYLLQNSIWWIEYAELAGIRMDTYPYPDIEYMEEWTCRVMSEYPNFNVVGEEWYNEQPIVAHWQRGKESATGHTSCLPSLMDFPLQSKVTEGLNAEQGDWSGWLSVYSALANDFVYADPSVLVVFPDNHDMSRFFTQVNEDFDLFKLGLAFYSTTRGIPQFYYGTEILMKNPNSGEHGVIRSDFPGGWDGDKVNAFTGEGLTDQQVEAQDYMKKLLNWRKQADVVHDGKLLHYNPKNGFYVYFRYTDSEKLMVVLSKNKEDKMLDLSRFNQMLDGVSSGTEILTGTTLDLSSSLNVPAMSPLIIEIR